jgi:hypothetical protein
MKIRGRYNSELLNLKKLLFKQNNKKLYNYVMIKIKKHKYEDIEKIFDLDDIFYSIMILKMHDKKYLLKEKYNERKEYLYKLNFYEKIKIIRNDLNKKEIVYLIKEMKYDNIKKYIENYELFTKLFIEIDKDLKENIPDWIKSIRLDPRIMSINNLMGLGLYIRNNFIHNGKIDSIINKFDLYFEPDSLSRIILNGYRYYKIGLFKIFGKQ